jgi:ribosomal protein L29
MAMDDLFQALNMFKSGVKDLQTSRVIQGANEQVQQIRASEASEADKRNQLTQLSQQLVGQLGAVGAPVSDIAQQAGNVAPKQYANANQMNEDALLNNKPELAQQAQTQQGFENNKAFTLAMIKAQAHADPLRQMQFEALQDERLQKHIEGLDKRVDTQTGRFGNINKLQGVNNMIAEAKTLINSGTVTRQSMQELARKFDSILSQGAATVSGTEHLAPDTLAQRTAAIKELVTNKPQNIKDDLQGFLNYYGHAFDRIKDVNDGIIKEGQKQVIAPVMRQIARSGPKGAAAVKGYIQDKLGVDSDIDPKTGKISFKEPASAQAPAPMQTVMVRDKNTGQMIKALRDANGNLFKAE